MWRDVCLHDKDAILEMLARFSEDLASLQRAIRWGDGDKLFELFTRTRAVRRSIVQAGQEVDAPGLSAAHVAQHPETRSRPASNHDSGGIVPSGMKPLTVALPRSTTRSTETLSPPTGERLQRASAPCIDGRGDIRKGLFQAVAPGAELLDLQLELSGQKALLIEGKGPRQRHHLAVADIGHGPAQLSACPIKPLRIASVDHSAFACKGDIGARREFREDLRPVLDDGICILE